MGLADDLADGGRVHLVACDEARNIRRGYRIERSVDLFGHHIVDWSWGRLGTAGQSRRVSFAEDGEARRFVRSLLLHRGTAPRRIGLAYQVIASSSM
jgi:predicted DNA-binding WGR domain protein